MSDQKLKLNRQTRQKFDRIQRLSQIQNMDPIEFEQFVGHLYQKEGYRVAMTITSGDEGVDLFLRRGWQTAVVQCKRYVGTVGQPTVRDLYGAMVHNKARRAMLVTSGNISRPAEDWARGKPIDLIDGHELMSWARRSRGFNPSRWFAMRSWGVALIIFIALVGLLSWGAKRAGSLSELLATVPGNISIFAPGTADPVLVTALQQDRLNRQIIIDGDLSDWTGIPEYASAYRINTTDGWNRSDDLGVIWQLAWNRANLVIAVMVTDDVVVAAPGDAKELSGDNLRLVLETTGNEAATFGRNVYRIALLPGDLAGVLPLVRLAQGSQPGEFMPISGPGTQIAVRPTKAGYDLEATVPWSLVPVAPEGGLPLRVVLEAADSDDRETAVPEVTYAHLRQYQIGEPTTWGIMRLQP